MEKKGGKRGGLFTFYSELGVPQIFQIQSMISLVWLPILGNLRAVEAELVDIRRDNHDLDMWRDGYGPAIKESFYFTLITESNSRIRGPGWEFDLHPGDGLFVAPGEEIQATFSGGAILRSYNLHFNLSGVTHDEALQAFPRVIGLADDSPRLRNSLDCLVDSSLRHHELLQTCDFNALLLELVRIPLRRQLKSLSPLVREALDLIHRTILANPTREGISEQLAVTPNHLSSSIKLETGRSVTRHLQDARVRAAKDLIYSERLNVSEVADRLGMDIHSFSRLFKSITGKSPGQYKRETMTGQPSLTPIEAPHIGKQV